MSVQRPQGRWIHDVNLCEEVLLTLDMFSVRMSKNAIMLIIMRQNTLSVVDVVKAVTSSFVKLTAIIVWLTYNSNNHTSLGLWR